MLVVGDVSELGGALLVVADCEFPAQLDPNAAAANTAASSAEPGLMLPILL